MYEQFTLSGEIYAGDYFIIEDKYYFRPKALKQDRFEISHKDYQQAWDHYQANTKA